MGAICAKNGKFIRKYQQQYFKHEDTIEFVAEILRYHGNRGREICIFWDNCSIHFAPPVLEYLADNKITHVKNLPYEPEHNGIETVWGIMK